MPKIKPPKLSGGKLIPSRALSSEAPNPDRLPPKFSLEHLHRDFCISACTPDERLSFIDKMLRMSKMTWMDLRLAPRHGMGFEKISRDAIRTGIPTTVTDDVDFIAFRFCGKAPMVGFRTDDGTFYIVWFDRAFKLYDHG